MDRRTFLKIAGAGAALAAIPWRFDLKNGLRTNAAWAFAQSPGLTKFADPLPGLGPTGIPVAVADKVKNHQPALGYDHYSIDIGQFNQVLHSDFVTKGKPAFISHNWEGTTLRGYGQDGKFRHLGGLFVAQRAHPIQITFTNKLDHQSLPIPVDVSPFFPEATPSNKTAVHIHGGYVPWISDGGPFDWFAPDGTHGESFLNNKVLNPKAKKGQAEYYYPNDQSARLLWYHDHAHDITRLNAYVGMASGYLIVDSVESQMISDGILPNPLGAPYDHGVPLVIQDKIFVPKNIHTVDPSWQHVVPPSGQGPGNLWYAHVYDPARWSIGPARHKSIPDPSVIPEFFGDTMLMNGHVFPFLNVPPQRVRFRLLDACNARFVNLQLWVDDGSADSITMANDSFGNGIVAPSVAPGPKIIQVGTEAGFLPAPVVLNSPPVQCPFADLDDVDPSQPFNLLLAPGERADIIIDFNGFQGQDIILYTDAPAPFPSGDAENDYYPGSPNPTTTVPGFGPHTRQIMKFKVGQGGGDSQSFNDFLTALTPRLADAFAGTQPPLFVSGPTVDGLGNPILPSAPVRQLTLNEDFDAWGRLIQTIGTNVQLYPSSFGRLYADPATENITAGDTEVWQFTNLTGDTHPIHTHLVNWQVLARQPFDTSAVFNGTPQLTVGPAREPDPNEKGWKETVRMNPGEVIWVAAKYDLAPVPFDVPYSPRTGGNEYVYHCHILEHEEHDMMRPLVVNGKNPKLPT